MRDQSGQLPNGPIIPKHLEFLAAISSEWAIEKRRRQRIAAELEHERELHEFIEAIAPKSHPGTPTREVQAFVAAIAGRGTSTIREASWDPAKHPRRGGPPNAGWWASASGSGGGSTSTSYQHSIRPTPSLAAWHPPVGHHWVPISVVQNHRSFLSDDAVKYASGKYSGPTDPSHGNTTAEQIKHTKYSKEVETQLKEYMKENKITEKNPMTGRQMKKFADRIERRIGANGEEHEIIKRYNTKIKELVKKGAETANKYDDVLAAGQKYMKHARYRFLAAGAVLSGVLGEAVAAEAKILDVAAKTGHYERAIGALQRGDLNEARKQLLDDADSLYAEILVQVGAHAALNYKRAMEKAFEDAANRNYN